MNPDLDGDGVLDICDPCLNDNGEDVDGDGVCDAVDNCPYKADSDQADEDGDGNGDACDLCPGLSNPGQTGDDGDGLGNACDCEPTDPAAREPEEVESLIVEIVSPGTARVSWTATVGADIYHVTRGDLGSILTGQYGSCFAPGLADRNEFRAGNPQAKPRTMSQSSILGGLHEAPPLIRIAVLPLFGRPGLWSHES